MQMTVTDTHAPRRPWLALLLSLVEGGLGHIYCGRIVKGLILFLIYGSIGPLLTALLLLGHSGWQLYALITSAFLLAAVWLYAVVDAVVIAVRTPPAYQLKDYNRWYVYLLLALMTLPTTTSYSLLIREGIYEAFRVAADGMCPTFQLNDRVLVDKRAYRWEPVRLGDVVVLLNPNRREQHWIKRVVALPSDTVEIRKGEVYVNGEKLARRQIDGNQMFLERNGSAEYKILLKESSGRQPQTDTDLPKTTVPPGHCFVLGDNRNCSRDSRHEQVGPIPLADVVGRVECVYYPRWSRLH